MKGFAASRLAVAGLACTASPLFAVGGQDSPPRSDEVPESVLEIERDYDANARNIVGRDHFPVFDDPELLSPEEAERVGAVRADDLIIGIEHDGEAKAYPVPILGVHELGNDTIGGIPVAVSW